MKNTRILDVLAEKPQLTLGYSMSGNQVWSSRKLLCAWPMKEIYRTVHYNVNREDSTDDLIIKVLQMNPGTELQLLSNNGAFPYFALRLNGKNPKELKLPEKVSYGDGGIWYKWEREGVNLCLLETR